MKSPYTGIEMIIRKKRKHLEYKNVTYFVNGISYYCKDSDTYWQTDKQINNELNQVYKKHENRKNK